eukprot:g10772.t1
MFVVGGRGSVLGALHASRRHAENNVDKSHQHANASSQHHLDANKRNVWLQAHFLFESADASQTAAAFHKCTIAVILISIVTFVLQTEPSLATHDHAEAFFVVEALCTAFFTFEYVGSVLSYFFVYGNVADVVLKPMKLCDFFATIPFYIELLLTALAPEEDPNASATLDHTSPQSTSSSSSSSGGNNLRALRLLRIVRLSRLSRVLKLGKYSKGVTLISVVIHDSAETLLVLFFCLVVAALCFASLLFYLEKHFGCPTQEQRLSWTEARLQQYESDCAVEGAVWSYADRSEMEDAVGGSWNGDIRRKYAFVTSPSESDSAEAEQMRILCCSFHEQGGSKDFPSIASAIWFTFVSTFTVGYGDQAPRTKGGYLAGSVILLFGTSLITLPVAVIGGKFQELYEASYSNFAGAGGVFESEADGVLGGDDDEAQQEDTLGDDPDGMLMQRRGIYADDDAEQERLQELNAAGALGLDGPVVFEDGMSPSSGTGLLIGPDGEQLMDMDVAELDKWQAAAHGNPPSKQTIAQLKRQISSSSLSSHASSLSNQSRIQYLRAVAAAHQSAKKMQRKSAMRTMPKNPYPPAVVEEGDEDAPSEATGPSGGPPAAPGRDIEQQHNWTQPAPGAASGGGHTRAPAGARGELLNSPNGGAAAQGQGGPEDTSEDPVAGAAPPHANGGVASATSCTSGKYAHLDKLRAMLVRHEIEEFLDFRDDTTANMAAAQAAGGGGGTTGEGGTMGTMGAAVPPISPEDRVFHKRLGTLLELLEDQKECGPARIKIYERELERNTTLLTNLSPYVFNPE